NNFSPRDPYPRRRRDRVSVLVLNRFGNRLWRASAKAAAVEVVVVVVVTGVLVPIVVIGPKAGNGKTLPGGAGVNAMPAGGRPGMGGPTRRIGLRVESG